MVGIFDSVIRHLYDALAKQTPEKGGALLGPSSDLVSDFLYDTHAACSGSTYQPSRRLRDAVNACERDSSLHWQGIVHSHPFGIDRLSEPDVRGVKHQLALNGRTSVLAPLVVRVSERQANLPPHEMFLGDVADDPVKFALFKGERRPTGDVVVKPEPVEVFKVESQAYEAYELLEDYGFGEPTVCGARIYGRGRALVTFEHSEEKLTLQIALEPGFPAVPPAVWLATKRERSCLSGVMGTGSIEDHRLSLVEVVRACLGPIAAHLGRSRVDQAFESRQAPEREPVRNSRVAVVGAGSVGATMAELLARSNIGHVTVIDPDTVEANNLARCYEYGELGSAKAEVLVNRIRRILPNVGTRAITESIERLRDRGEALDVIGRHDLVIAALDSPEGQYALNEIAFETTVPAIYVGIYQRAAGGECVLVDPTNDPGSPCFACQTGGRGEAIAGHRGEKDYGTGRLEGEPALAADIQSISAKATKLALALLAHSLHHADRLAALARRILGDGTTYVIFSTEDNNRVVDVFPKMLSGSALLDGAFQTLFLEPPSRDPHCPFCGEAALRTSASAPQAKSPSLARLRGYCCDDWAEAE